MGAKIQTAKNLDCYCEHSAVYLAVRKVQAVDEAYPDDFHVNLIRSSLLRFILLSYRVPGIWCLSPESQLQEESS